MKHFPSDVNIINIIFLKPFMVHILSSIGTCAGIFKQSMAAGDQIGIGLLYRPAMLHSLTELVPCNQFLGSLKV
jgi:hypothetical protein